MFQAGTFSVMSLIIRILSEGATIKTFSNSGEDEICCAIGFSPFPVSQACSTITA